jgi:hypothetical protein
MAYPTWTLEGSRRLLGTAQIVASAAHKYLAGRAKWQRRATLVGWARQKMIEL